MASPKTFQTIVLGSKKWGFCFVANEIVIDEYDSIDLLGIRVDNQLKCTKHISNICERSQ